MRYVPVVKAREAEIDALLTAPGTLNVTPLFELQTASAATKDKTTGEFKRSKSSVTDASYFLDDIARLWPQPLFVDTCRVAPSADRGPWWSLLTALNAMQAQPATLMPVLSTMEPSASRAAAAPLAAAAGRAAVRILLPTANPAGLATELAAVATDLNLPASQIDVVLDWQDGLEQYVLDDLQAHTSTVLTALGPTHGEIITVGTPNSNDFLQVGDWRRTRREWWLWLRLAHSGFDVTYGDYVLYPPSSPVPASPNYGHLRYSSGPDLWVHRRARPATGGGLAGAFAACCTHLVGKAHYLGAAYSNADAEIAAIAAGTVSVGAAGAWRRIASEHHFAHVAQQLATPPAAPPPGTA